MNTRTPKKKLTISLDADVYEGLRTTAGERGIGAYLSKLARPHVVESDIEAGYKAMARDEQRENGAREWFENASDPIEAPNNWNFS